VRVATLPAIQMPHGEKVEWLPRGNESEEERERKRRMIHKQEEQRVMLERKVYEKMVEDLNQIEPIKHNEWEEVKINRVLPKNNEENKI
jgi:hypothetical protein